MSDLLSGIGDYYTQYSTTDSTSDKLSSTLSTTDYSNATDDELMDVCKDFEAYFVEQVIKAMEKMIPEDEDEETNSYLDYFGDTLTQEMASAVTDQNDLGLAQMLYEQMKRNYGISEE
jgi:flagellar protein FlgJ